ncbi:MAG: hypothetical protein R6X31_09920 [Anaerolineae bacterium]
MTQELAREALREILEAEDIEALSVGDLVALIRGEIEAFLPDGVYRIDPRNGDRILYHSSRGGRPHDNVPESVADVPERECIICQGQTTGVVDVAELSEGFTFINKNLFPILYPFKHEEMLSGLHLLQWTSSQHDKDWHNMPLGDRIIVLERLTALERTLLGGADELARGAGDVDCLGPGQSSGAFVVIIKNYGHLVGGSLIHGHQQIAFSTLMPRHFADNARFEEEHGETFSEYMMRKTPPELVVKDYGPAILLVPPFMRRPYDMMLFLKDTDRVYLHELEGEELEAVAEGWHDGIRAIREIMPRVGREIAYNVITNNGPGAGLYFEFLPYTQETGGVEHLGLLVCQELPERAAARLRKIIS